MFRKYLFRNVQIMMFFPSFLSAVLCAKNLVKKDFFRKYPSFINTENVCVWENEWTARALYSCLRVSERCFSRASSVKSVQREISALPPRDSRNVGQFGETKQPLVDTCILASFSASTLSTPTNTNNQAHIWNTHQISKTLRETLLGGGKRDRYQASLVKKGESKKCRSRNAMLADCM